jgi:YHYH protein
MSKSKVSIFGFSLLAIGMILSCKKDDSTTVIPATGVSILSVVQSNYKTAKVTTSASGSSITLKSDGSPDHVSPYWGVGHALYEAPVLGQHANPGIIQTQNYSMTIPLSPAEASTKEETTLGAIGMALNGVAIYNDREGGNLPVDTGVLGSFDRGGGHPAGGRYHYHCTGEFTGNDNHNLIGFLRDGFPIYARKENDGTYATGLDANGGHVGTTAHFTTPIYHYHASNTAYLNSRFYILKAGSYHGTKGTFTQ